MKSIIKKASWFLFTLLCIVIGLYPINYFVQERTFGLLGFKTQELLQDVIYNTVFNGHIILGGIALIIGWTQFSEKIRSKNIKLHRNIGKVYVISVMISGLCGLYIALHATGGLVSILGFMSLAVIWLVSTFLAYRAIKNGAIKTHQNYMILSYAACFAAVTLRLWMPLLMGITGDFIPAYQIVAWLCWVPNILVAMFIIR